MIHLVFLCSHIKKYYPPPPPHLHMLKNKHQYYLSSPFSPLSMASGSLERSRSCVTAGEPRHKVDSREMTVEMLGLALHSGVRLGLEGVLDSEVLWPPSLILCRRHSSSWIRPWRASGAGSTDRRVKRSASEAKHRRAPSATWKITALVRSVTGVQLVLGS